MRIAVYGTGDSCKFFLQRLNKFNIILEAAAKDRKIDLSISIVYFVETIASKSVYQGKPVVSALDIQAEDFDYLAIARDYEEAGASAISVLTEPYFFQGSNDYLSDIAKNVSIPILRKDFVVDEYMIWEAKALGASAILLIVSILDIVQLKKYLDLAHELGLSAIVETHDGDEIRRALTVGAEIIGVNNRNLQDFTVDIENSIDLRRCVSGDVVFISESGIKTVEDVNRLKENDVDAVLIGETLMKSDDKKAMIEELKNG